jgi:hypothetical protein
MATYLAVVLLSVKPSLLGERTHSNPSLATEKSILFKISFVILLKDKKIKNKRNKIKKNEIKRINKI